MHRRMGQKKSDMIEIMETSLEDLEAIAQIERQIFSRPWSRDGFEASVMADNTVYLTARLDGEIAGYCGMIWCMDEAEITNVAVKETCRKKGVAIAMLQKLLACGNAHDVRSFILEVRKSNVAAIALYEKLGFKKCGVRKNFYEKPTEDAIIMWKH